MASRPNPRAKAQRATAKAVRAQREARARHQPIPKILPTTVTAPSKRAQIAYGQAVIDGREPWPAKRSAEGNQLARLASLARNGKAPAAFEAAFSQYWYHDDKSEEPEEADEGYEYDEDEEEEE